MKAKRDHLPHILRILGSALALGLVAGCGPVWLVAPATVGLFLAVFSFNHDLLHGALGFGPRAREALLTLNGAVMLSSGHGVRVMHLRHHARPLSDDDVEGLAATMSFGRALLAAVPLMVRYRSRAVRAAPRRERRLQRLESALNGVSLLALLASGAPALQVIGLTTLVVVVAMPIWAGYLPHRPPPWLVAVARRLLFLRSVTVLSLVFHEEHHRRPKVPCQQLARLGEAA